VTIYYTHSFNTIKQSSHELLEIAIADYLQNKDKAAELVSDLKERKTDAGSGKPYIEGFNSFSISHSGNSWAVLIADRECGLDIQYERSCDYLSISRRFFANEDAALVSGACSEDKDAAAPARNEFFRIWTRREAFIKAIGSSVVREDYPAVGIGPSVRYEDKPYYIGNIGMPEADVLHAAICLEAERDIDEELVFKEIYVKR